MERYTKLIEDEPVPPMEWAGKPREIFSAGDDNESGAFSLSIYLNEIRRLNLPLLTRREEVERGRRWMERMDFTARDELVMHNLRYAIELAKQREFTNKGLPLVDLIQAANRGLIEAADRFDYRKGCRFTTHAFWWIRRALWQEIKKHGRLIYLPRYQLEDPSQIERARKKVKKELGRSPTNSELAVHLKISEKRILHAGSGCSVRVVDVQSFVSNDPKVVYKNGALNALETSVADRCTFSAEDMCNLREQYEAGIEHVRFMLKKARACLNPTDFKIFLMRFGLDDAGFEDKQTTEVSLLFGLTKQAVNLVERKFFQRIGHKAKGAWRSAAAELRQRIECLTFMAEELGITNEEVYQALHKGLKRD